jgi:YHS domain-containing protein
MKKMIGVLGVVAMLIGSGVAGAAEDQAVKKQSTCPVMGGAVNTNLFVDFEGKRIYVCCKGCLPEVKKDPAKYIAKLEKDGITLDKVETKAK